MSATGRPIDAEIVSLDEDSPKQRRKLEAEIRELSSALPNVDPATLRAVISAVRAKKRRRARAKNDYYETPEWVTEAVLPHVPVAGEPFIVDAGAGTGAISAVLARVSPKAEIVGVEKSADLVAKARERRLYNATFVAANFLHWKPEGLGPDVIIMNPPFSRALEFVSHALEIIKRGGTVAALMRVNMLAGVGRIEFWRKHPADMHVLAKRPSFTGRGTDATEYAWFVWRTGLGNKWTISAHHPKKNRRPRAAKAQATG